MLLVFQHQIAMSEFYGYGGLPSGLVAGYNSSSYPGSGTAWNDISGFNRHMITG